MCASDRNENPVLPLEFGTLSRVWAAHQLKTEGGPACARDGGGPVHIEHQRLS